jgi:hypothetical protein
MKPQTQMALRAIYRLREGFQPDPADIDEGYWPNRPVPTCGIWKRCLRTMGRYRTPMKSLTDAPAPG